MFDAHHMDISDELKGVVDVLRPQRDKLRLVLNKADQVRGVSASQGPKTLICRLVSADLLPPGIDSHRCSALPQVNGQALMRQFGALMWTLSRVLSTPEVCLPSPVT